MKKHAAKPHAEPKVPKSRKSLVKWNEEELELLGQTTWELYLENPEKTILSVFQMAQDKALPKSRHRRVTTITHLDKVFTYFNKHRQQLLNKDEVIAKLQREIVTLQSQLSHQADLDQIWEKNKEEILKSRVSIDDILMYYDVEDIVDEISVERLMGLAAQRFTQSLVGSNASLIDLLLEARTEFAKTPAKLPAPERGKAKIAESKPLPKVAFVGLKSEQQQIVQKKLKGKIQFVSIDKRSSMSDIPRNCDVYILWTRFMSHSTSEAIKSSVRTDKVVLHQGGLELMVKRVEEEIANL